MLIFFFKEASGVPSSQWREPLTSRLGVLAKLDSRMFFSVEEQHQTAVQTTLLSTDEKSDKSWQVIQSDHKRIIDQLITIEGKSKVYAETENTPLICSGNIKDEYKRCYKWSVDYGLILFACPMTQEGNTFLGTNTKTPETHVYPSCCRK